jgi:hypothetical protein
LEEADRRFANFKSEIEHSPLNVLRNEIAQKQIAIVEMESKVAKAYEDRDEYRQKFDKVKKDMIALKKQLDHEKELKLTTQAEELESIKKQMRQQALAEQER